VRDHCVTVQLTEGSECDWVNEGSEGKETRKARKLNYIAEY